MTVATHSGVILVAAPGSRGVLYRPAGKNAKRFAGLPPFRVTIFCQHPLSENAVTEKGLAFRSPLNLK